MDIGVTRMLRRPRGSRQKTRLLLEDLKGQYRQDIEILRRSAGRYGYDLTDLIRQAAWCLHDVEEGLRLLEDRA